MIAFIDIHRQAYGVEPICKVLPIAPSVYYAHKAAMRDPSRLSARAQRDAALKPEILRVFHENKGLYGARKLWQQLKREGVNVARCTVERLMKSLALQGVRRGRKVKTTIADPGAACPLDKVNRDFKPAAPNMLWVSDFTYIRTRQGFVYTAFVIDAFARRIVGWHVSRTADTAMVLAALDQATQARLTGQIDDLIHHSDRGSQYVSIKYTERLEDAGIDPSVGSVGDSYDNALAETVIGLYKTEVINRASSWRGLADVELATLDWVHWYNNTRLFGPLGYIPPAEAEQNYHRDMQAIPMAA
jgi:transposase InsO family protein